MFGGSGFVGRYVARRLARAGWRVRVAVRRPNEAGFVRTYGVPGQVEPVLSNIRYEQSVMDGIGNSSVVINCVGILGETSKQKFRSIHQAGAERIARLASSRGVKRLVHVSSIGADPDSASRYAQTKAAGESSVLEAFPDATILRPSVIFGSEDQFLNRFASMARMTPVVPLVGARTRFQPVHVDDVAAAATVAATDETISGIFELGGPDILSFGEIIADMLHHIRRKRVVIDIPFWMASIAATKLDLIQFASAGLLVNRILTRDQVRQLSSDNIVNAGARGFAEFGIEPQSMEGIVESYLYRFRPAGQYTSIHESAAILNPEGENG